MTMVMVWRLRLLMALLYTIGERHETIFYTKLHKHATPFATSAHRYVYLFRYLFAAQYLPEVSVVFIDYLRYN